MAAPNNRLSHSAVSRYQQCPRSYQLHYQKRLRPKTQSAALLFGSAVDAATGALLKGSDKSPEDIFKYLWTFAEINGENSYLPDNTTIVYSDSEYDYDLLDNTHKTKLIQKFGTDLKKQVSEIIKEKEKAGFKNLNLEQKLILNNVYWGILLTKGILMIEAFRNKVMPKISEVLSVQEMVELKNDEGDSVIGYVDLVANLHEYGRPVILDIKTSSIQYKLDSVKSSSQLAIYKHALDEKYKTNLAGFIVLSKRVNKNKVKVCSKCNFDGSGQRHKTCNQVVDSSRCNGEWVETIKPEIDIQIIVDEIPERFEEIVLENYLDINAAIKSGNFIRNLSSCKMPWGLCSFYNLCHNNDSSDLEDMSVKPPTERKPFR